MGEQSDLILNLQEMWERGLVPDINGVAFRDGRVVLMKLDKGYIEEPYVSIPGTSRAPGVRHHVPVLRATNLAEVWEERYRWFEQNNGFGSGVTRE